MIKELQVIFNEHANDEKSIQMSAYLKDQFQFKGIMKPIRAKAQKEWVKNLVATKVINWQIVHELWILEEREFQYVALDYLLKMKKYLKVADIEEVKMLIVTKSWWDTVDLIADHLVGTLCQQYPELIHSHIKSWALDDNMWLRRTAILFQLKYKSETDVELLSEIVLQNNESKEFFIAKAIGWALREYSKTNPQWVKEFITTHQLQSLSVREGSKYLN